MLKSKSFHFAFVFSLALIALSAGVSFAEDAVEPSGEQADCHCSAKNDRLPKNIQISGASNSKLDFASDEADQKKKAK